MNGSELDFIREKHSFYIPDLTDNRICNSCETSWPCDVITVMEEVENIRTDLIFTKRVVDSQLQTAKELLKQIRTLRKGHQNELENSG